jgi:hypothetical protein
MAAVSALMSPASVKYDDIRSILPLENMTSNIETWSQEYRANQPYPHIGIDGFFGESIIKDLASDFPGVASSVWQRASFDPRYEEKKLSLDRIEDLPPRIRGMIEALNSPLFLRFLEGLTGIDGLIPDPYLVGGGLHMLPRGGRLGIHADFNIHQKLGLDRRLNLLLYLNHDWKSEWGGELELWDQEMNAKVKGYLPIANRVVIFSTTDTAFHGHPTPLDCPKGMYRKSIALYYYTKGRPASEVSGSHTTLFKDRPGDATKLSSVRNVARQLTPPIVWEALRRFR